MAAEEIYGYRDWELSQRHRNWGCDCPMQDADMIVWEYASRRVKAIVEYKHERVDRRGLESSLAADVLRDAAGGRYPAWITVYDRVRWVFRITPVNELAQELFADKKWYTERQYVELLHRLRGLTAPPHVLEACRDTFDYPPLDDDLALDADLGEGHEPDAAVQPPTAVKLPSALNSSLSVSTSR